MARRQGLGFKVLSSRGKGSHVLVLLDGRRTTVPMHGKDLRCGTLGAILRDLGLSKEDL